MFHRLLRRKKRKSVALTKSLCLNSHLVSSWIMKIGTTIEKKNFFLKLDSLKEITDCRFVYVSMKTGNSIV